MTQPGAMPDRERQPRPGPGEQWDPGKLPGRDPGGERYPGSDQPQRDPGEQGIPTGDR
jgi:hypothetical protein